MNQDSKDKSIITGSVIVLVLITTIFFFHSAYGQLSIDSKLEKLQEEGKLNCEIMQINRFLYQEVRIELEFESVNDAIVSVDTNDPASKPVWEKRDDLFVFRTGNFTDNYTLEVLLNYDTITEEPRRVDYKIYTLEDTLTHEGNWWHEGNQYCKIFSFKAEVQPKFPTPEEITEAQDQRFAQKLDDIDEKQTEVQGVMIWVAIIASASAFFIGVAIIINWDNIRRIRNSVTQPMKKYKNLNDRFVALVSNFRLIANEIVKDKIEFRESVKQMFGEIQKFATDFNDLSILAESTRQKKVSEPELIEIPEDKETEDEVEDEIDDKGIMEKVKGVTTDKISNIISKKETPKKTQKEWEKIYWENSLEDNQKLKEKLDEEYLEEPTNEKAVQLRALWNVMTQQVT